MKKSIIYILLAITFILAVAAIVPWVFIGYGVYKVADTSEKVSDAIEKALDTPSKGSGDRSLIRFCLKDINTPGRARIHQVSSRCDILRYLSAFLLCVPFLNCI